MRNSSRCAECASRTNVLFAPTPSYLRYFQAGSGGVCSGDFAGPGRNLGFEPPVGYWCGNQSEASARYKRVHAGARARARK